MIKSILSYIFTFSIFINFYSQEKVFETEKAFLNPRYSGNDSFALPNQLTGELLLILESQKLVQGVLLDSAYQEQKRIMAKPLPSKFRYFIGYRVVNNKYAVFFTNERESKFGVLEFNANDKSNTEIQLDFKLKKEKLIETVLYQNQMFLFTTVKNSSDINIYTFDENYVPSKTTISLSEVEYPNPASPSFKVKAFSLFTQNSDPFNPRVNALAKIESRNPNVLETTSKKVKLYQVDNKAIFSFDDNPERTDLFSINLDDFTSSYKAFPKVSKDKKEYKRDNSYLFDNKLFQIASSKEKMNFRIVDIDTKAVEKEYTVNKGDSINFKNSSILMEKTRAGFFGNEVTDVRALEKTTQFLRKISSSELGISVYKTDDIYNIVLGGTKPYDAGGGTAVAFGLVGAVAGVAIAGGFTNFSNTYTGFNPTYYNYYSYNGTKSTYINCLFDERFEHVKGDIPLNTYDLINEFEGTLEKPQIINVFMHQDVLHYNYFDRKEEKFRLFRFE